MSTEILTVAGHSVSPHHYINGQRVASDVLFDLHCPIDQSLLGRISEGTAAHVDAAVSAAAAAFPAWSALSAAQRKPYLTALLPRLASALTRSACGNRTTRASCCRA